MALAHKTIIGGLTITRDGTASLLLKFLIEEDGEELKNTETNYRILIEKGSAHAETNARIAKELADLKRAPLPVKEALVIKQTLTACWAAMNA